MTSPEENYWQARTALRRRMLPHIANAREASEICGLHRTTILNAIKKGDIPATREGGEWRVSLTDVDEYTRRPARPRQQDLLELYHEYNNTHLVAERMGIKEPSVRKALNRAGILLRPAHQGKVAHSAEEFVTVWNTLRSVPAIAKHFGIAKQTASMKATKLRKAGHAVLRLTRWSARRATQ